jgi:hypothetical protein
MPEPEMEPLFDSRGYHITIDRNDGNLWLAHDCGWSAQISPDLTLAALNGMARSHHNEVHRAE